MNLRPARWLLFVGVAFVFTLAITLVVVSFAVGHTSRSPSSAMAMANPDVDPGSAAGDVPAPGFELRDQRGRLTSLAQFQGKVVVLTFVDSHCTTICPLITEGMVQALRQLGPASNEVQLLGINANPSATNVVDVAAYTRAHQMQGLWRFLTGSLAQLKEVWRSYHVYVAAVHNDIDHEPIIFLIDRHGRERMIYFVRNNYGGVTQQAQVLADAIARLLPGHPAVRHKVSLRYVSPLKPIEIVQLPAFGPRGQSVVLGKAHPHLLLFFAGWLGESADLSTKLAVLNHYAAAARRQDWPAPVAIDELATEPSADAARELLASLVATLRAPIVEDAQGRLADGYQVQDLPWFVLTSGSGRILWHHDGWLSSAALSQQVRDALAQD